MNQHILFSVNLKQYNNLHAKMSLRKHTENLTKILEEQIKCIKAPKTEIKITDETIKEVLRKVAEQEKIKNYNIILKFDINNIGFVSDFFTGTILNCDTNTPLELVVKRAYTDSFKRNLTDTDTSFQNEIYFYKHIFPTLNNFQNEKGVSIPFGNIPKFYYGTPEEFSETVVLENLITNGYEMIDKRKGLNEEELEKVFQTFGRFHALSFALKSEKPEVFEEFVNNVHNKLLLNVDKKKLIVSATCDEAFELIKDKTLKEKHKQFFENCGEIYKQCATDPNVSSVLIHDDSVIWNIMFKYKSKQLTDVKLIDFQTIRFGSLVHDLSLIFYSSGSKSSFKNVYKYLQIYYESFSNFLKELGANPEVLYPYESFEKEWKQHCKFGIIGAIFVLKLRFLKETKNTFTKGESQNIQVSHLFNKDNYYYELFTDLVNDLITSVDEMNFI